MKPKSPVNPQKLSPGQKLIERADFDRAWRSTERIVIHAEVRLLSRRDVRYNPCDFDKIPFPVLGVVLQFREGSGEHVHQAEQGKGYTKDRRRIKPQT